MKTELLEQEKNKLKIKAEFEVSEFLASLNDVVSEMTKKANVPGFRKGRVPRNIIEMRFGKENLRDEAIEKMLPAAVETIIENYGLQPIAPASVDIKTFQDGEPLICEFTFEVVPEVTLPELETIEIEKLALKITDEMVDSTIEDFRREQGTFVAVDRASQDTDLVAISFVSTILGSDDPVESSLQHNEIRLSDPEIRQEIKNAVLGKIKGDVAEAEFQVDKEYHDTSLAGKQIRYDITIQEVKELIPADMNSELHKKMVGAEFDSEEAFKEAVREKLLAYMEKNNVSEATARAVATVTEQSVLEVSDTMLKRQIEFLKERNATEAKKRFNKEMAEILEASSIGLAEYEESLREEAEKIVRRTLVLDEIGKKYEVEVQKEEIDTYIDGMAHTYGLEPIKLRAMLFKDKERLINTVSELRYEKINRILMEKVCVKEVEKLKEPSLPTE